MKIRSLRLTCLVLPLLLGAAACEDEDIPPPADAATAPDGATAAEAGTGDAIVDAGAGDTSDASGDAAAEAGMDTAPASAALGVVVVNTDYTTAVVSLLDPATGTVTRDNCIGSGSTTPRLTTALSGDVVVPSQPQPDHELVLIDRRNATLTWVAPTTCEVSRQLNVGEGQKANPMDIVSVSPTKAYVTRYAAVSSDLAVINPMAGTITSRIDMKPHALPGPNGMPVLPNPSRGVFARGKAYVVLTALSADFKYAANGCVVQIDPASDTVSNTIELTGIKNCGAIAHVESAGALVVSCGGVYADPNQVKESGVAWIDLTVSPPAVKIVPAMPFGRALSPFDVAAQSSSLGFAITGGDFSGTPPDQLWAFDVAGGAPRKLLDGKKAFTLSGLLFDAAGKKLIVADANPAEPRVHLLDLADPAMPKVAKSVATSATALPPKYLSWY